VSSAGKALRAVFRAAALLVAFVLVAAAAFVIYLVCWEIPPGMADRALREINARGSFVIEAGAMRLDPARGLLMKNVRVYRKGRIGPAGLQADSLFLTLDLPALMEGRLCVDSAEVRGGVLYPELFFGGEETAGEEPGVSVAMRLSVRDFVFQDIRFRRLDCRLEAFGPIVRAAGIRAAVESGGASGDVSGEIGYDRFGGIIRGSLDVRADPRVLVPTLARWEMNEIVTLVERFDFKKAMPRCKLTFSRAAKGPPVIRAEGDFELPECRYRGVPILRADGRFNATLSDSAQEIDISPFLMVREEGTVRGWARLFPRESLAEFDADSTVDPKALVRMLDLVSEDLPSYVDFAGEVRLKVRGTADLAGLDHNSITGEMSGHGARAWMFVADEFSCEIDCHGTTNTIRRLRGRMYGGDLIGKVVINMPGDGSSNITYMAAIALSDAEFKQFARVMLDSGSEAYSGRMTFHTRVTGVVDDYPLLAIRGKGSFRVSEGKVFMLPLFGGFTDYMARIIPGMDLVLRQTEAKMDFEIADGKVKSDKIEIEGGVLTIGGRGVCLPRPDRTELDYHIQVKLLRDNLVGRIVRLPTWIISKLFEFRLKGTLEEPRWYLVNFSSDLLARMGLRREPPELKPIKSGRKPEPQQARPEEPWSLLEPQE